VDIVQYRKKYYATKLPGVNKEKLCHDYLEGVQWVLSYYTRGVPNWKWRYMYNYAPFCYSLKKYISSFEFPDYSVALTKPTPPFVQLLCVLPPTSAKLLPKPLRSILSSEEMVPFCPKKFDIDISGCSQTWQGRVLLPFVDYSIVEKLYTEKLMELEEDDIQRNIHGKTILYKLGKNSYNLKSKNGDFLCFAFTKEMEM
jgi:5'-3' exonuclease